MLSLVTNGTGFVASHLVDALVARGESVIIAGDLRIGTLANVEAAMRTGLATFVYVDHERNGDSFHEAIRAATRRRTIDRVFHLRGARLSVRSVNRGDRIDDIDDQTVSVIDVAATAPARLIITLPLEADDPVWHAHGMSSSGVPRRVQDAVAQRGVNARIVRVARCYGPRMTGIDDAVTLRLAQSVLASRALPVDDDSGARHPMLYVADAVELLRLAASSPLPKPAPFEIHAMAEYSLSEITEVLLRIAPVRSQVRSRSFGVSTPAGAAVTTLQDGLMKTLRWLRDSSEQQYPRPLEVANR